MKKFTAIGIILIFVLQILIACGAEAAKKTEDTTKAIETEITEESTYPDERINRKDNLPADLDFGGQEVRILLRAYNYWELDFPEQSTGDVIHDAVYEKNLRVQDRLNVKFRFGVLPRGGEFSGSISDLQNILLSGDDMYDLGSITSNILITYGSLMTPLLMELSGLKYVDLDQPWWNIKTINEISHDGKSIKFLFGESSVTLAAYTTCMFYNKKMYNDYYGDPDELYRITLDGKWTLDYFDALCRNMYEDLNGDGIADVDDQYGLCFDGYIFSVYMLGLTDAKMSGRDSNGKVKLDMDLNRLMTFTEKMYNLCYNNPGVKYYSGNDPALLPAPLFMGRKMAFSASYLSRAIEYRAMEDDYGILPMPKLDEQQSAYRSFMTVHISSLFIPKPSKISETVSAVMEALASDGYRNVTELYCEVALKTKYSRDEYSGQAIDLIISTQYTDFLNMYLGHLNNSAYIVYDVVSGKSTDLMSYYAKNEAKYQTALEKLINTLSEG